MKASISHQDADIQSTIAKAIALIDQVVQKESEARGSVYTHDKFFKEVQTNDRIHVHVEDAYRGTSGSGAEPSLRPGGCAGEAVALG